ncbi:LHFPL tetraspan subfamily member 2 protein isoform X1 [Equus quagga]|uniref:LHFPL tetraspan subfamily member 2 protein isoform X1 n=1 Tax=Equus quagga TaxID=89248 RepID=UPI001EE22C0C|nr:LHFPL tetraspan subfamily member 2 protein isoform X1 [Equus quagga]
MPEAPLRDRKARMGVQAPRPTARSGFPGPTGRTFSRSGPAWGTAPGPALRPRSRASPSDSDFAAPATPPAVRALGAPETPVPEVPGAARGPSLDPGGTAAGRAQRAAPRPRPPPLLPGIPFRQHPPGPQDPPLRRPGLVRPPARPARRAGGPRARPSPRTPGPERDGGGDGDWAAAGGGGAGRPARRVLPLSAPAPRRPPRALALWPRPALAPPPPPGTLSLPAAPSPRRLLPPSLLLLLPPGGRRARDEVAAAGVAGSPGLGRLRARSRKYLWSLSRGPGSVLASGITARTRSRLSSHRAHLLVGEAISVCEGPP